MILEKGCRNCGKKFDLPEYCDDMVIFCDDYCLKDWIEDKK